MTNQPRRILLVDDDVDLCRIIVKALQRNGVHVATAHDLAHALHCLHKVKPEVVVLDNNLPDGLGTDFIPIVKEFDPHIRIYMITADLQPITKDIALREGVNGFMPKPFSLNTFQREVLGTPGHEAEDQG